METFAQEVGILIGDRLAVKQCVVSIFSLIQIFKEQISQTSPEDEF
ncbi:hypothetical protein [Klebsiella pneumoniae]